MNKIDMNAIGKRIQERRKELGISQQEACKKLSLSQNHYSRIENGYAGMSLEVLLDISELLNVSTDYILTGRYSNEENPIIIEKLNSMSFLERKHVERYINLFADYISSAEKFHQEK